MSKLVVGFDSAWTIRKRGALVGVFISEQGERTVLGTPVPADFSLAGDLVRTWKTQYRPQSTVIMLDQPTIVANAEGQRPVENLVAAPVSLRYGGVQPSHTGRVGMFDSAAPIWPFLGEFGGAADPRNLGDLTTLVIETYPVLTLISMGWLMKDDRNTGRLPKYNPARKKTFDIRDWSYLCEQLMHLMSKQGLGLLKNWLNQLALNQRPGKTEQDQLDACICLLSGLLLVTNKKMMRVGELETGYMLVPWSDSLFEEIASRCLATSRDVNQYLGEVRWTG